MNVKVRPDQLGGGFIIYSQDAEGGLWSEELIPQSTGDAALHNRLTELGYPNGPLHARLLKGEIVPSPSRK